MRDTPPERSGGEVSGILVEPTNKSGISGPDPEKTAPRAPVCGSDQLVDELVLGGHRADEIMRTEVHVGSVVSFELRLEVVDQRRVHVLMSHRTHCESRCRHSGEAFHISLRCLMVLGPDPSGRGREPEVLRPAAQGIVQHYSSLFRWPTGAGTFPSPPRASRDRELAVVQEALAMRGQTLRCMLNGAPSRAQSRCSERVVAVCALMHFGLLRRGRHVATHGHTVAW
ncbi:hypothetical protein YW7DRAFT_01394 [Streptomyces sp. AmelKG-E11A]|nr:hypothetical protein YW7DRAFT_01394 [Streptomyces sp. AmelKG-E11A]